MELTNTRVISRLEVHCKRPGWPRPWLGTREGCTFPSHLTRPQLLWKSKSNMSRLGWAGSRSSLKNEVYCEVKRNDGYLIDALFVTVSRWSNLLDCPDLITGIHLVDDVTSCEHKRKKKVMTKRKKNTVNCIGKPRQKLGLACDKRSRPKVKGKGQTQKTHSFVTLCSKKEERNWIPTSVWTYIPGFKASLTPSFLTNPALTVVPVMTSPAWVDAKATERISNSVKWDLIIMIHARSSTRCFYSQNPVGVSH